MNFTFQTSFTYRKDFRNFEKKKFKSDGITSDLKGVALGVLTADCVPILIYDKINKKICVLHAGWKGIFKGIIEKGIKKFSKNKINSYLKKYNHVIFQKYISKISKGDKRVFIINGRVKGAISRVPKKGSILSNMSKGASAKKIEISQNEMKTSKIVATELKKQNIYFAGIDFIQGKLIGDINVTSPTGLKTYYDLTGVNLGKYFFDNI